MRQVPAKTFTKIKKSFKGYAAVWFTGGLEGQEICICAPTHKKLRDAWLRITGMDLQPGAQRVRISAWKKP